MFLVSLFRTHAHLTSPEANHSNERQRAGSGPRAAVAVRGLRRPAEAAAVPTPLPAGAAPAPAPAGVAPTPLQVEAACAAPPAGAAPAPLLAGAGWSGQRQAEVLLPAPPSDGAHHGKGIVYTRSVKIKAACGVHPC